MSSLHTNTPTPCIILDPGHGGISPGGHYLTRGKQSPHVPPGIYEGEFNRDIARRVAAILAGEGIESVITAPGPLSPRESDRVKYANALHAARGGGCIYVAIHANAEPSLNPGEWGTATGTTVFVNRKLTPRGWKLSTVGEPIARRILAGMDLHSLLSPKRGVRGKRFQILRATKMPAVLVECGFMTNKWAAKYMASLDGRRAIAWGIAAALC